MQVYLIKDKKIISKLYLQFEIGNLEFGMEVWNRKGHTFLADLRFIDKPRQIQNKEDDYN